MVSGVPCVNRGNWGWECDSLCYHVLAFRKQHNLQNAVFCEGRIAKIPVLCAHLTYKMMSSVFGMGRSTNSIAWKASQMCKVHTSSHERTNEPYVTSNYENTSKSVTADLTTNDAAKTNTSFAGKVKNVLKHNFEGGANKSELDRILTEATWVARLTVEA